jgi:antitoxin ParD1/3/4
MVAIIFLKKYPDCSLEEYQYQHASLIHDFFNPQHWRNYQFLVTLIKFNTMGRNTSISLGNHFEDFVDDKVSTGRFKNASEVIRAGLRLLEEEETKIMALKKAVTEGFESGVAKSFDPKKHLEKLKAAKRKNG